jgi:hypothetical protein
MTMFADLLPSPTLVFDWYTLGFPAGLIACLAVAASIIALGVVLARYRFRTYVIIPLCLVLFVAADLVIYVIGVNLPRPPRPQPDFFRIKKAELDHKPTTHDREKN